jgi:hypothetical protein
MAAMQEQVARCRGHLVKAGSRVAAWSRKHPLLPGLLVALATAVCVFVLPLFIPVAFTPTVSASYVAGFDNHTAVVATAVISVMVLLWTGCVSSFMTTSPVAADENRASLDAPLGFGFMLPFLLICCCLDVSAGWLVAHSHLRYTADLGYFIEQLSAHGEYGRHLYSQLEFAYGPLLFYPTAWIHALLRSSWISAYIASLMVNQLIGLVMLAYCLNALPIRTRDRKLLFAMLALGAANPLLGLNYTFLRFIAPLTAMLFCTTTSSLLRSTAGFTLAGIVLLGVSPELGLAFLAGVACYAALQAFRRGVLWLLAFFVPLVGIAVVLLTAGHSYLRIFTSFSRGTLNIPVGPYPHLVLFLFAAIWLVPRAIGRYLPDSSTSSARLVACYFVALGMLPAALGRCDPLHVFFNGAGIFVLSAVGLKRLPKAARAMWTVGLITLVCWVQWVNNSLYADRTVDTLRLALMPALPTRTLARSLSVAGHISADLADQLRPSPDDIEAPLDLTALESEVGNAEVATPMEVSPGIEDALKGSRHYRSDFYAFFVDVMNPLAESRKIASLNTAQWALLPTDPEQPYLETPQNIDGVQGFAFPYPMRHPVPYPLGRAFNANLKKNWIAVRELGGYTLYRNLRVMAP